MVESQTVVEAIQLSKRFGDVEAVRGVSFGLKRGEVFGFFGPNGAGKTTTIRLLCGLTAPTTGSAMVLGQDVSQDPRKVREVMAILPEEDVYYEKMTPATYLRFFAKMAGHSGASMRSRIELAVRVAEVSEFMNKRIGTLSHGQRQRVSVARTILRDVPLMFLDEPFTGIDIVHRRALRAYLRDYVSAGNTVFYTSHNLIEAEHVVDRFAFIDRGRILMVGTSRELREKYLLPTYALAVSDPARAQQVLADGLDTEECRVEGVEVRLTLKDRKDVPRVAALLGQAGIALTEMRPLGTMEEVFLRARQQGLEA